MRRRGERRPATACDHSTAAAAAGSLRRSPAATLLPALPAAGGPPPCRACALLAASSARRRRSAWWGAAAARKRGPRCWSGRVASESGAAGSARSRARPPPSRWDGCMWLSGWREGMDVGSHRDE